eukprot:SAG11_NODE_32315_length_284_cov_1.594595_1_plen_50_part_10
MAAPDNESDAAMQVGMDLCVDEDERRAGTLCTAKVTQIQDTIRRRGVVVL